MQEIYEPIILRYRKDTDVTYALTNQDVQYKQNDNVKDICEKVNDYNIDSDLSRFMAD